MRAAACIKAIVEVYGKTLIGLGPKEESQACFVGYLGSYVCDLLYVFDTLFGFQCSCIFISAFKMSNFFKTKFIKIAEK